MSGRPTDCTPEVTKQIADNIALGLTNEDSATLAGVSETSFYAWIARGNEEIARVAGNPRASIRKNERPFVEFSEAIKKAKPRRKQLLVGRIQKAARDESWQAAAWLLERLHNKEFGRKQSIEHSGKLNLDLSQLSDEELDKLDDSL